MWLLGGNGQWIRISDLRSAPNFTAIGKNSARQFQSLGLDFLICKAGAWGNYRLYFFSRFLGTFGGGLRDTERE